MEHDVFKEPNIGKAYLQLSLPLALSMTVTLIYNLADTYFVAQTGDTNLVAGVSLGAPVFTLLMAFGNIFGQGGASLISRLMGQEKLKDVRHVSSFCFYATIIVGVVSAVIMLALRSPILVLIGATEETISHASSYYTCLAIGAPAVMVSFIHSNLLRSEGMSKESMTGTIGGALINIVLDPILISVMGMGAMGAALASVLGYLCSDIFFVIIVHTRSKLFSLNPVEMGISGAFCQQIFGIGIPAAISNIMSSVCLVLLNQFLQPYGTDQIAAMGIVQKVNMIALLLLTGFAFGGQPLFGYYYGANDHKRFRELVGFCLKFIGTMAIALTAIVFFAAGPLLRFFMDNDQIVSDGTLMLRWQVITMLFVGLILLVTIMFQSTGKVVGSFILSVSRQGVVFCIVLMIATQVAGYTGILVSQAISDVITGIIALLLFFTQLYPEIRD